MTPSARPLLPGSSEDRLQLLVEAVTDYGIFMLDPQGRVVTWNSGAQNLKGWRRNEILELTWDEVDLAGGVIRLSPRRSTTRTGRVLPLSAPLRQVL